VDYVQLIAPMIKAIQELTDEVERLKNGTSWRIRYKYLCW
jgi:hypothetical protein